MDHGAFDLTAAENDEARAALARLLAEAEGLPGHYYSGEFFQVEQRLLFPRGWAAVGVGTQVPDPGDILPIDLAGWPLILVRGVDGGIAAFHNICRHRALLLVSEPCSGQRSIRCPWHAWRYGLDGQLLATPEIGGARDGTAPGFDKGELGLKPIRVERWLDYIFVNIDGFAPPFEDYIAPVAQLLGNYRFEELRYAFSITDAYKGNWKIVTEAGIEDYHLPFGHPQLNAHLLRNSTPHVDYPIYAISTNTQDFAGEKAEQRAWNASLIDLPRHDETRPRLLFSMNVFPTGTILVTSDHLMLGVHLPDGPDRTKVSINIYTHADAATSPDFANGRKRVLDLWTGVLPQDAAFIEGAQATMKVRDAAGIKTRFAPYWEAAVHGFQARVLEAIR
jgi:choline monooxygenase